MKGKRIYKDLKAFISNFHIYEWFKLSTLKPSYLSIKSTEIAYYQH